MQLTKDAKTGEIREATAEEKIQITCLAVGLDPEPYLERLRNAGKNAKSDPKQAKRDAYYKELEKKYLNK